MTASPTARPPVAVVPGSRLEPAPDLRSVAEGRILIGGAPLTIVRLSQSGAELARRWFAGAPIDDRPTHHAMVRRLESNGMAHLRLPSSSEGPGDRRDRSTVVIPVKDDRSGLDRTLRNLDHFPGSIVVVDDGSSLPIRPDRAPIARPTGLDSDTSVDVEVEVEVRVKVVRRPSAGGPASARQVAVDALTTPVTIFVDAGVAVSPMVLNGLTDAFDDPAVVAAAPRVTSEPRPTTVGRYDERRSPLDLGPAESLVGPGRAVPYVPTACLAVRTDALRSVGGFDRSLRYGEDVDLVWRLASLGAVRYLPHLTASHRPRSTVAELASQRRSYGSAAAPLAARHGADAVSPCRISPWSLLVAGLMVAGRPATAAATAIGTGLALKPKIEPLPDATIEALSLTIRGHWYGARSLLTAVARTWSPLLPVLWLVAGSQRRRVASVAAAAFGRRLLDGPREPGQAATDLALGVVDDLSYAAGVWQGAIGERSASALRPALSSWPGGGPGWRTRLTVLVDRIRPSR